MPLSADHRLCKTTVFSPHHRRMITLWPIMLMLLLITPHCVAIKWLALHRVQPPWSEAGDCPRSREERKVHGLSNHQARRICARSPELMPHISSAATMTMDLCQWTFADRRWNCSSLLNVPNLTRELTSGTKEQGLSPSITLLTILSCPKCTTTAFVLALSSAAVTHQIAKACSSGQLANCPCGHGDSLTTTSVGPPSGTGNPFQPNLTELSYKWKGCSDNVKHGRRISEDWSSVKGKANTVGEMATEIGMRNRWGDIVEEGRMDVRQLKLKRATEGKRNGQKAQLNEFMQFNNEIGRQIAEQSLYKKCKCHGVSGSCNVKTCWLTLAPMEQIAEQLKERFDGARPMQSGGIAFDWNTSKRRWKTAVEGTEEWQNLVYVKSSPNYCEENPGEGSFGTRGRECNITSYGTDSCESLCCGRGWTVSQVRVEENCQCKFVHCCYIKCKKCTTILNKYFCK